MTPPLSLPPAAGPCGRLPSCVVYVRVGLRRGCHGECAVCVRAGVAGSLSSLPLSSQIPGCGVPGYGRPRVASGHARVRLFPYSLLLTLDSIHVGIRARGEPALSLSGTHTPLYDFQSKVLVGTASRVRILHTAHASAPSRALRHIQSFCIARVEVCHDDKEISKSIVLTTLRASAKALVSRRA